MNQQKIIRQNRMQKFRRMSLYSLLFLFCCLLENTWYAVGMPPPLLCAALAAGVGMCEGPEAALFGVFTGLIYDAAGGSAVYLSPVLFALYALLCGLVTRRFFSVRFWLFALYLPAVGILQHLLPYFAMIAATEAVFPPLSGLTSVLAKLLLSALSSLPGALLLYPFLRLISGNGKKKRTADRRFSQK